MASVSDNSSPTAVVMRKRVGMLLARMREREGLTQRDVGVEMGYDYWSLVSQFERGLCRVPPEDWPRYAALYHRDPQGFAKEMLYWYDPNVHFALFGGIHPADEQGLPRQLSVQRNVKRKSTSARVPDGPEPELGVQPKSKKKSKLTVAVPA